MFLESVMPRGGEQRCHSHITLKCVFVGEYSHTINKPQYRQTKTLYMKTL